MRRPITVTVLSSLPPQRGVTPYTMQLLAALSARSDVEVDALGFRSLYPRRLYPGGAPGAGGDGTTPVPADRCLTWYNPLTWIRAGLRVRSDVVHAQWWSWFLALPYVVVLALARMRGKRVVVTVHNAIPHEQGRFKRWLNALVMRQADEIIVHTRHNVQQLINAGADAARITVVPHGLLPIAATARTMTREDARRALDLPRDAHVALLFGNIRPYKGTTIMMKAAAIARIALPNFHLVIAGDLWKGCDNPIDSARRFGVQDSVTCHLGYASDNDVGVLFAAADVVVLPYVEFDGQSGAGTLALSAGRAMIVTDVGGLPDLVRDRRAVVPAGDPASLAAALIDVLNDEAWREKLEADAALVRADLSWNIGAEATVGAYRRALRRAGVTPAHADAGAWPGRRTT